MAQIHASAERIISGSPEEVYTYIADHKRHHPNFLPPAFSHFRVEEGGVGAGTVVSYRLKAGGRERAYRARIDEPEPGRVLTETLDDGKTTSFTVTPFEEGTLVRIDTRYRSGGALGWLEGLLVPRILQPLYEDELERLEAYARTRPALA
jgi:uncharacterized protein YndB with AHSA1/START domain